MSKTRQQAVRAWSTPAQEAWLNANNPTDAGYPRFVQEWWGHHLPLDKAWDYWKTQLSDAERALWTKEEA